MKLGRATSAVTVLVFVLVLVLTLTALLWFLLRLVGLLPGLAAMLILSRLTGLATLLTFVFRIVCHEKSPNKTRAVPRFVNLFRTYK